MQERKVEREKPVVAVGGLFDFGVEVTGLGKVFQVGGEDTGRVALTDVVVNQ